MSVISVERFSLALAAGDATSEDTNPGGGDFGKSQTAANCIPFITSRVTTSATTPDTYGSYCIDAYFSGTTVVVETGLFSTREMVVEVTVVEFDGTDIDVQQGVYSMAHGSDLTDTDAPSAVTLVNTFLYHTYQNDNANQLHESYLIRGEFTSNVLLTFERLGNFGNVGGHWYTAEATEGTPYFTVQEVVISLPTDTDSDTDTITSIATNKTWLMGSWMVTDTGDDVDRSTIDVTLTNGTTVTAQRHASASGGDVTLSYTGYAITFDAGNNAAIQRGTLNQVAADPSASIDITEVDPDEAMVLSAGCISVLHAGSWDGTTNEDNIDAQPAWDFTDGYTKVRCQHIVSSAAADNQDISWEVIEWGIGGAPPTTRRVMVIS